MPAVECTEPTSWVRDAQFKALLQQLRRTDNLTNWYYLARTYFLLALVAGSAIWWFERREQLGLAVWWNLPIAAAAVFVIGALQHHLGNLAHEAVHHTLFKNRWLNDLTSEILCSFPLFGSTFHYGLHHLAHHQFVNDPIRDPDLSQMEMSGHNLRFPIRRNEFLKVVCQQLWLPNLYRYSRARAEYDSFGTDRNPYIREDWQPSKLPRVVGSVYLALLVMWLSGSVYLGDATLLAGGALSLWMAAMIVFRMLPDTSFYQSRIRPLLPLRVLSMMALTYVTLVFTGLAWATLRTGTWWFAYYLVLWIVPLLTAFPFYMLLRQIVQHGNADRGWLTNTRVFHCHPLLNFAVFPMGQDYHLPHHMFATVPHYRLHQLHDALMQYPEYRGQATVVEGYVLPKHRPPTRPTVIDVLGDAYAPREQHDAFIDNSIFDQLELDVVDREELLRQGEQEIERTRARPERPRP